MAIGRTWILTPPFRCILTSSKYLVTYFHHIVFTKDHSNILEDFLYVTFRALQFTSMIRAKALVDIMILRPLRWLSGKARELNSWSPVSMGEALDLAHEFMVKVEDRIPAFSSMEHLTFSSSSPTNSCFSQSDATSP